MFTITPKSTNFYKLIKKINHLPGKITYKIVRKFVGPIDYLIKKYTEFENGVSLLLFLIVVFFNYTFQSFFSLNIFFGWLKNKLWTCQTTSFLILWFS